MTVKAVAFSHAALLVDDPTDVASVRLMLQWLAQSGIDVTVLSTHPRDIATEMARRQYPPHSQELFRDHPLVQKSKGAPEWITATATVLNIKVNQCLVVGVTRFDWYSAVNAGAIYAHAGWVQDRPATVDCLVADDPRAVPMILSHFLLVEPRWSFMLDDASRNYSLRALLPASASLPATNPASFRLQDVFTYSRPVKILEDDAQDLLMLHALTSAHLDDLIPLGSFFCIYPGSPPGTISQEVKSYLRQASALFRSYLRQDLILRAIPAPDTSLMRYQARQAGRADPSSFLDQANTVHLNTQYRDRISGRTVAVFDDFTTSGMSLEWSRCLLMAGGADKVVGFSIGKYGTRYRFHDLNIAISPFGVNALTDSDFTVTTVDLPEVVGNVARMQAFLDRWVHDR
jgi:hypothetical protein